MKQRWDEEADVVTVGYGGAGAAAAVTAADLGASVLILEKQPESHHTPSTKVSGGYVVRVSDVDNGTRYLDRCAAGLIPLAVSRAWAERAINVIDWVNKTCPELEMQRASVPGSDRPRGAQHPSLEGAESIEVYSPPDFARILQGSNPGQSKFFPALQAAVARRTTIKINWESPVQRLIRDQVGRVAGVEVTTASSGTRRIGARKGVILSCGGYEYNEEMKQNYLKAYPIYFYGNPGNTGDGIRMAQAVGADLWHMNLMIGRAIGHFELDENTPLNFLIDINPPGYVFVDKYGRRFANESEQANYIHHTFYFKLLDYDVHRGYSRIPCYWFFDQRRIKAGPLGMRGGLQVAYSWSRDNESEITRGWIKQGKTIEDVAALAGVTDPEIAARTVDDYNQGCRRGVDSWGRNLDSLVPLDQPPFYCVPLYPGGPSTCGGPRRNEYAQILDPFMDPIPGLFGAGELGGPLGLLYPSSGSNLSECMCFGQIAAEAAVNGVSLNKE